MINVLPQQGRSHIRKLYLLRLATLAMWALGLSAFLASAMLAPVFYAEREEKKRLEKDLLVLETSAKKESESATSRDMTVAAAELVALEKKLAAPRPSRYFGEVLARRGQGVAIERLEFLTGEETSLRVSGVAGTRESLTAFARRLEGIQGAPRVDLPVSNFTKSADAPFSLTLYFHP
jgi:hypothetical protein